MEDRCICCGEIIPEGRQVCPNCEQGFTPAKIDRNVGKRRKHGKRILDKILGGFFGAASN